MSGSLHKEHRARLKQEFLDTGLDPFADHKALELLLFFAIPQRDVNELAHTLINHYGSFAGVLDASYADLLKQDGVGEHTAVLLKLIPALARRYGISRADTGARLTSVAMAGEFLQTYFIGCRYETIYALFLDGGNRIISCKEVSEGCVSAASVSTRRLVELALETKAAQVIIAHNHLSGIALPSMADQIATKKVATALRAVGVVLRDHLIFTENDYVSFAESGLMHIIT